MKSECCKEPEQESKEVDYSLESAEVDSDDDDTYDAADEYSAEPCDEDHDCPHKCYMRGSESICVCDEGFQLSNDGYSCTLSIASEWKHDNCERGFRKNSSGNCEDIDECEQNFCKEFETCKNTVGSYDCELSTDCRSGFEFNHKSNKCEGKG